MSRTRSTVWMVTAALAVGMLLRLLFLGSKGFWLDEVLSISLAADPVQLLSSGFDSAHPPLYYTLLHYWLPLGQSEFMLRLSSALVSCLAIPVSYALAVGLGGRGMAYTTLWLTALAPLFVWYAQELRSYSLLAFLGLLVMLALMHLIARPNFWWWALFIVAMSAALYTHYAAILLIAAQLGIIAVLYLQQRVTRKGMLLWLAAWPLVALLYAPWLAAPGMQAFIETFFSSDLYPVKMLALRFSISPTLARVLLLGLVGLVTLALLAVAIVWLRRGAAGWTRWATMPVVRYGVLLLFLAFTIISVMPRLYTVKKLVVALWPYGLLVVAWLFPWKVANRVPLILLLTASLLGSLVNVTLIPKDQWREMAAYLHARGEPTDSIWIIPRYQSVPLNYYLAHGTDARTVPSFAMPDVIPTMSDAELMALVEKGQRVWLIYHAVDFRLRDPERRLEGWLREHFMQSEQLHLYRINATLYTPQP